MRRALCTLDGQIYDAADFNQDADFEAKRNDLVCTICEGSAYYRSITRNGRAACFGAHHEDDCLFATVRNADGDGNGRTVTNLFTTGQRIIVNLNTGATAAGNNLPQSAVVAGQGTQRGNNTGGTTPRAVTYRSKRKLLRALMDSAVFRTSVQPIEVPGQGTSTVAEFFVKFTDVTHAHRDTYHGYWGIITSVRPDGNTLWFNTGSPRTVSIFLDSQFKDEFLQRYPVTRDYGELAGAHMLVFGTVTRSTATGKLFIPIPDLNHFCLIFP